MKKLILSFLLLISAFPLLSQIILPSLHGVHHNKKIPTNGQVAFFDFSSGESGYTLSGATATSDKNGNANSAIEVDDATDRITGQFSELLDDDFTVSIWAKLNSSYPSRKMWLISFGSSSTNKAFHLGCRYDNSLNGNYRVGSWNANHATDDNLGNDTNWKHYIVTYDKSEEEYKFYIIATGGGSANKTFFYQGTPSLLKSKNLESYLMEKIMTIGSARPDRLPSVSNFDFLKIKLLPLLPMT